VYVASKLFPAISLIAAAGMVTWYHVSTFLVAVVWMLSVFPMIVLVMVTYLLVVRSLMFMFLK